jgi:hypothetical protein
MEKFNCPKCHVISDVEVTEDTKFFELQKKCIEELKHYNSLPWYKRMAKAAPSGIRAESNITGYIWYLESILNDVHKHCIICPICYYKENIP